MEESPDLFEQGVDELKRAGTLDPSQTQPWLALAGVYGHKMDFHTARSFFHKLPNNLPAPDEETPYSKEWAAAHYWAYATAAAEHDSGIVAVVCFEYALERCPDYYKSFIQPPRLKAYTCWQEAVQKAGRSSARKLNDDLILAVSSEELADVKRLLDAGADVNADINGTTALRLAVDLEFKEVEELLRKRGATRL